MQKNNHNLFFDCDGIILDSNHIKTEAFRECLKNEKKENIELFINYHKKNQGIDRFKKLNYFFSKIKKNFTHKNYLEALNEYSSLCAVNLKNSELVSGVKKFLENANKSNYSCYVISGSEQNELRNVLKYKKLDKYFKGIYGSPLNKIENINLALDHRPPKKNDIFFGDAKSDMIAAIKSNLKFIYLSECSDWVEGREICNKYSYKIYKNFDEVIKAKII